MVKKNFENATKGSRGGEMVDILSDYSILK